MIFDWPVNRRAAGRSNDCSGPSGSSSWSRSPATRRPASRTWTELNRLFTAWSETVYHARVHSETGQPPMARWLAGRPVPRPGRRPSCGRRSCGPRPRLVRKTATVSLYGNAYQVDPVLAGRKVELVFDPFDLTVLEIRWHGQAHGLAIPHQVIGRHSHPKAQPEEPAAAAAGHRHRLPRPSSPPSTSRPPAGTASATTPSPATAGTRTDGGTEEPGQ